MRAYLVIGSCIDKKKEAKLGFVSLFITLDF